MSPYHKLVAEQLAEVNQARKNHRPVKPIIKRNKQARTQQLRRETRFARVKFAIKRIAKWLKGGA